MSEHSKAAAALLNAKTKHQPLEIVIGGLEPMRTKARIYEDQPVADYHGWKIIIPRTEFIPDYVESTYPGEEQKDRENRYLYSAIGIKADIIPQSFLPEQSICIASRLEAMQVKRDQYWFATESVKDRATKEVHMEYALREGKRIFLGIAERLFHSFDGHILLMTCRRCIDAFRPHEQDARARKSESRESKADLLA